MKWRVITKYYNANNNTSDWADSWWSEININFFSELCTNTITIIWRRRRVTVVYYWVVLEDLDTIQPTMRRITRMPQHPTRTGRRRRRRNLLSTLLRRLLILMVHMHPYLVSIGPELLASSRILFSIQLKSSFFFTYLSSFFIHSIVTWHYFILFFSFPSPLLFDNIIIHLYNDQLIPSINWNQNVL